MNENLTEIAFILDRSGSMQCMVGPAINGFNDLLHEQQKVTGQARLTLALFDDEYEVPIDSLPLAEITDLDSTTYVPRGCTALLDAIGRTIDELGAKLSALPEADRPGQVIVAILTDGMENASQHFSWDDVSKRIKHQTDTYQWKFLFLGANQDAIATAGRMNIAAADSANFTMQSKSYRSSHSALHRKMSSLRKIRQGNNDPHTVMEAQRPLDELRQEEEDRVD